MRKINYLKGTEEKRVVKVAFIKSIITTFIVSALLMVLTAVIFNKYKIPREYIKLVSYSLFYFSFLLCGFMFGINNRISGWKSGFIGSLSYLLILLILGLFDGISLELNSFIRIVFGIFLGITGGIIGINTTYVIKNKRKKRYK